jgi:hypothetical protein
MHWRCISRTNISNSVKPVKWLVWFVTLTFHGDVTLVFGRDIGGSYNLNVSFRYRHFYYFYKLMKHFIVKISNFLSIFVFVFNNIDNTKTDWIPQWFSQGTPVSSTNKTDCHDITDILFKVALNTINLTLTRNWQIW